MNPRRKAFLALTLLVPAPSLGAFFGMIALPNTLAGVLLFGFSKVWLFSFPVLWLKWVEKAPLSLSPARRGGFVAGILSGVAISAAILFLYATLGGVIDRSLLTTELRKVGLGVWGLYVGAATYWILVNSVLEEYVWRWFCVWQCERLWPKPLAIVASALFFTLHHIVAMSVYFTATAVAVCSLGVFLGGVIWSLMYVKYRSVWPGYVSHAIVDLAIFGLGAALLFGTT